jgi:cell division protein FtsQ
MERAAKGVVLLKTPYYVDGDGFLFKAVDRGEKVDFPLLTGLEQEDLASRTPAARHKIREVLRLSNRMERRSLALSEIHFTSQGGVVFYPMAYSVAFRMGWGDWEEKMQRLERVLGVWQGKEDRLAVLDFSFRNQVVARIKKTGG